MAKVVMEKEVQLSECLQILGPVEYHRRQSAILLLLTCKKENLKEKRQSAILLFLTCKKENLKKKLADEKGSMMIQKFDRDKESSLEQIRGEDVPPCLLGYFPYAPMSRVVDLAKLAKKELGAQHVAFDPGDGVQKGGLALRKNENERFGTWIENELA
jgi:hypothetical protein